MAERVNRRTFLYMSVTAAAGALAFACAAQSKSVEVSATAVTPTPKREPEATPSLLATATETPTRVPPKPTAAENPEDRATRMAETKMNMWPKLKWANAVEENSLLYTDNPDKESARDQLIALGGCADSWARQDIISVDQGIAGGVRVVAFKKENGVLLGLRVVEENGGYVEGTLLLALDSDQSVSQNTLIPVGGREVLDKGCQVAPTFVTANVDDLLGSEFSAGNIVWDSQRNTLVAKDGDGRVVAFVNPKHQTEGKTWELVSPPTPTPKPPTPISETTVTAIPDAIPTPEVNLEKAPKIEGLIAVLEGDKVVYYAEEKNPYGLAKGEYGGEFLPEVRVSGIKTGGVALRPEIVSNLIDLALSRIEKPKDKWIIALPLDPRDLSVVSVTFEVGYGGEVPLVKVAFQGKAPAINVIPGRTRLVIGKNSYGGEMCCATFCLVDPYGDKIYPGREMEYITLGTNFQTLNDGDRVEKDFGEPIDIVSGWVKALVCAAYECFEINPEKVLSVGKIPVFVASMSGN